MENGLQTTIIVSFFGFLFTGITGIAVFFLIRLIKTIDKLTDVVERMDKQLFKVDLDLNDHASVLEAHAAQISHLAGKGCSDKSCAFYDPDMTPIPRMSRTRLEDGALGAT